MHRKASTFRIAPDVQAALANLSVVLARPMNQLVNDAVRMYVERRSREAERDLEASLASLRAYRLQDPDFEEAIEAFAEAEASVADPLEGHPAPSEGPIQAEILRLLHG